MLLTCIPARKKKGKNKVDFVMEGSLVINECKRFYVENGEKIILKWN